MIRKLFILFVKLAEKNVKRCFIALSVRELFLKMCVLNMLRDKIFPILVWI